MAIRSDTPPASGTWQGRTHILPVRVYYEDTDFTGVVYHANYLRYMERGRSDALRAAGIWHGDLLQRDPQLAFTVIDIHIAFKQPGRIDDLLNVHTRYDRIKGPRLLISQQIMRGDDVLIEAEVQAVTIDMSGRPKRFPKDLLARLAPYLLSEN